jgi:hypothetical protein
MLQPQDERSGPGSPALRKCGLGADLGQRPKKDRSSPFAVYEGTTEHMSQTVVLPRDSVVFERHT